MTTTNTYLFNPDLSEYIEEAFERIGIEPGGIGQQHLVSARRSMNFMFTYWQSRGVLHWAMEQAAHMTTPGETSFTLPKGGLDILTAVLRRDGVDVPMSPIAVEDYNTIPDKTTQGRPDRYFVERRAYAPTVHYWQAALNNTDQIVYWYFRQIQDAGKARNTIDMPHYWAEAFTSGLAAALAEKYAPQRLNEKQQLYDRAFEWALMEDGSRAPLVVTAKY